MEDWTRLSGLTHLLLRRVSRDMVRAGLPQLTTLQSLVVDYWGANVPGGRCPRSAMTLLQHKTFLLRMLRRQLLLTPLLLPSLLGGCSSSAGSTGLQHICSRVMPDAADLTQLARLTRLTHLDLGTMSGAAALAPLLPDLQSLALRLEGWHPTFIGQHPPASASASGC
jgi:hypothetical protein